MAKAKNEKIRCFYPETVRQKPVERVTRHFIHSEKSGGYWAAVRDATQAEKLANDAIGHETVVHITVGYNPKILQLWDALVLIDQRGASYRIKGKPDEYTYQKEDLKIIAYQFKDTKTYEGGDKYD